MAIAKVLELLDLYIAAFLLFNGIPPKLILKNGKVLFVFGATDEVYRLMNLFNSNEDVPVADYTAAIKTLRGRMLTAKENINGHGNGDMHGYSSR